MKKYGIPFVPITDEEYILPETFEELKASADGPIDQYLQDASGLREGFVYRKKGFNPQSFKNVSNAYLLGRSSENN